MADTQTDPQLTVVRPPRHFVVDGVRSEALLRMFPHLNAIGQRTFTIVSHFLWGSELVMSLIIKRGQQHIMVQTSNSNESAWIFYLSNCRIIYESVNCANVTRSTSTLSRHTVTWFNQILTASHKPKNICSSITHDVGFIYSTSSKQWLSERKQVMHFIPFVYCQY